MANEIGSPAGTQGMSAMSNLALPENDAVAGRIEPFIGRTANRDVAAYFGFTLIRKGETVTREIAERALNLGRLYEVIAATEEA